MKNKRIAILLVLVMIMSLFAGFTSAYGASADYYNYNVNLKGYYLDSNQNPHKTTVKVEKGQTFYIADWWEYKYTHAGSYYTTGVTYKSSNKSVATVTSKGKVVTKATGTATISIKKSGETIKVVLKVVSKDSITNKLLENVDYLETDAMNDPAANAWLAVKYANGSTSAKSIKIISDNAEKTAKALSKAKLANMKYYNRYMSYGRLYTKGTYTYTSYVVVPQYETFARVITKWNAYTKKKRDAMSPAEITAYLVAMSPAEVTFAAGELETSAQAEKALTAKGVWLRSDQFSIPEPGYYSAEGYTESLDLVNASGSRAATVQVIRRIGSSEVKFKLFSSVPAGTYTIKANEYYGIAEDIKVVVQ